MHAFVTSGADGDPIATLSTCSWFNKTFNMSISKDDLIELLSVATKNQLFQFNENLYEQVDGVAMGSPLLTADTNGHC